MGKLEIIFAITGILYIAFFVVAILKCIVPCKREQKKIEENDINGDIEEKLKTVDWQTRELTDTEKCEVKNKYNDGMLILNICMIFEFVIVVCIYSIFFNKSSEIQNVYKIIYLAGIALYGIFALIILNIKYIVFLRERNFAVRKGLVFGDAESNGEVYYARVIIADADGKKHVGTLGVPYEKYDDLKKKEICELVMYKKKFLMFL